jgi:hypothetical protein
MFADAPFFVAFAFKNCKMCYYDPFLEKKQWEFQTACNSGVKLRGAAVFYPPSKDYSGIDRT